MLREGLELEGISVLIVDLWGMGENLKVEVVLEKVEVRWIWDFFSEILDISVNSRELEGEFESGGFSGGLGRIVIVFKRRFVFDCGWDGFRFVGLRIESWGDCKFIELDSENVLVMVEKVWEKKVDGSFDIKDGKVSSFDREGVGVLKFRGGVE